MSLFLFGHSAHRVRPRFFLRACIASYRYEHSSILSLASHEYSSILLSWASLHMDTYLAIAFPSHRPPLYCHRHASTIPSRTYHAERAYRMIALTHHSHGWMFPSSDPTCTTLPFLPSSAASSSLSFALPVASEASGGRCTVFFSSIDRSGVAAPPSLSQSIRDFHRIRHRVLALHYHPPSPRSPLSSPSPLPCSVLLSSSLLSFLLSSSSLPSFALVAPPRLCFRQNSTSSEFHTVII